MAANDYDAIVIGGGHNGLVSAAYLAKAGKRTVVLERRSVVGGAAVTEQPFGPDYKVTMLSYVVSLLPPTLQRDLDLARHGYRVHPQHGYSVPYVDGRSLHLPSEPARRRAEISKFSSRDADAIERFDEWLHGLADVLGPLLTSVPPSIGSLRPRDLLAQGRLAWKLKGLGTRGVADVTRLFSMSVADLLDVFFESPQMLGVMSVSGVIGTWAGPRSPGTAYVMAHHKIGDVGHGQMGSWGFPEGGMGGATGAMRRAAESFGVTVRTGAAVQRILVRDGAAQGVVLARREETLAPEGKHVMSMFTQWVPHEWSKEPHRAELDAYADRVLDRVEELAPGFKSSILHRQVIGPHEMETEYGLVGGNIFHGELSIGQ